MIELIVEINGMNMQFPPITALKKDYNTCGEARD